jgi:hypothetical protein
MLNKKYKVRVRQLFAILCATCLLLMLGLVGWKVFTRTRGFYWFRWWEIVSLSAADPLCSAKDVFKGVWPLRITCEDRKLAAWIISKMRGVPTRTPIVVPAQALFYRVESFNENRVKYLTITWNDFMNRQISVQSARQIAMLNDMSMCNDISRFAILLFRTPNSTMVGSARNFSPNQGIEGFEQEEIESMISKLSGEACFHRYETSYKGQAVILFVGRNL